MKNVTLATLHHFFMVLAIVAVASSQAGKGSSEFQPNATPSEKAATENLKRAAESGSAEAQSELSKAYMQGNVFRPNLQEAFRWVRAAAEQGLAEG